MYEINVSLNGTHLFATAERSITSVRKMKDVWIILDERFPAAEGFQVTGSVHTKSETFYGNLEKYLLENPR